MKLNIKDVFEGKVSNIACGEFNKLYGREKLSKIDILSIFINSKKHYLNELGKTVGIDGEIITHNSASYICIMPDGYTTEKGDQIYVWMHRKSNGEFGKVNIGIHSDFEIYVSENNSIIIGLLCFENHKHFESFEKSMKNAEIVTDSDFNLRNFFEEHAKQVLNSNDRTLDAKAHSNSKIEYNTNLKTADGKCLFIEGYVVRLRNECFIINPTVKLYSPRKKRISVVGLKKGLLVLVILLSFFKNGFTQSFSVVVPSGQTLHCSIYNNSEVDIIQSDSLTMKGDLIIPDSVSINNHTYPITGILGGAFKNCDSLLSIHIPKTINYIEPYGSYCGHTFEGCSILKDISVDSENNVFDSRDDCNAIIKTSSNTLIAGCKDAEIPNSVVEIGDHAFHKCSGLSSMTIPNSVIKIGNYAFSYCTGLISLTIPNSVTKIGNNAFFNCNSLTSITIPKTLDSLGVSAFSSCDSLMDVLFLADSCVIFNYSYSGLLECFNYCNNITNFVFGENVKYIPSNICKGLTGLTSVTIPKSVERIGNDSFRDCTGLRNVIFNADSCIATGYNNSSFAGCSGIENITFGENVKNIPPNLCNGMNNLRSVTIPDSVINIGETSFYGCDHITNISFGNGLRNIGNSAFRNCTEVVRIKSYGTVAPTVQSTTFSGMSDNVIVNVPCGYASVYENAAYWHRFDIQENIMCLFEAKSSDPYCGTVEIVNAPSCDNLEAVVQANPYHNYRFSHWTDGNNDNPRYIVVLKDTSIEAVFVPDDGNESINQFDNNNVNVWSSNKQIYVDYSGNCLLSKDYICVYDLMGRQLITEKISECGTQRIGEFESGVYLVKIGNMYAHKVVVL